MPDVPTGHDQPSRARWLGDAAGVAVAMIILGGPALFTRNGFDLDFTNHMWLVWVQAQAISQHGVPTYFLSSSTLGVLNPFFAFYGGTAYAITGAIAALLGDAPVVAYVGSILAAIAAAYAGTLWLTRQLGVRSWMAHGPAIAYVSSAYYVTLPYGRGDWPEFIAASAIPLLGASAWYLARAERIRLLPAVTFVLSAVIFSGSHNITLLWGTTVAGALLLLLLLLLRSRFPRVRPRRLLALLGLGLLAGGVNSWFLFLDIAHASSTPAGRQTAWVWTGFLNSPGLLFDPLRRVPAQSGTPALFVQVPDWFLAWALLTGGLLLRAPRARLLRRGALALLIILAGLLALIMISSAWSVVPHVFRLIQFAYRLNTYVAMAVAGLVLVGALAIEQSSGAPTRSLRWLLVAASAISVGLCVWQLWIPNTRPAYSYVDRREALISAHVTPRSWYDLDSYVDLSQPVVSTASDRVLLLDPNAITGDHVTLSVTPPAGSAPFATNIAGGPYVVRIRGLQRVGRTEGGMAVVRRPDGGSGPVRLTLEPAGGSLAVAADASLTAIAALLLLLLIGLVREGLDRGRRRRLSIATAHRSSRARDKLPAGR